MVLLIKERVFLVECVFREGNRYTDLVQEKFADKFPETPVPYCNAFRRVTEKFRETGSVLDGERIRPSKINDKKLIDVSDFLLRSASELLRKLAQEKNIGLATAHKAVREKLNLFPHKVTAVQKLKGYALAQLVEALRYKPEDLGIDSRWCYWNFSSDRTMALGSTQPLTVNIPRGVLRSIYAFYWLNSVETNKHIIFYANNA
jgi:hypothetical protein